MRRIVRAAVLLAAIVFSAANSSQSEERKYPEKVGTWNDKMINIISEGKPG